MIQLYCKKCKQKHDGQICPLCGNRSSDASATDMWSVRRVPISDGGAWARVLIALGVVTALVFALVFGVEAVVSSGDKMQALMNSDLLSKLLTVPLILLALFLLLLALQGSEVIVYVLDGSGAHLATWHKPSALKSLARLQSPDPAADIPQPDGKVMHLSQERHMLWADVHSVRYHAGRGQILLYHTPHCAPMILCLPAEEYEAAAAYVQRKTKNTAR